ncbi:MAG: TonB-dependent receptor [Acidimicrobiia bacterium]|nr:TonB-dependent receptor [Acidimicrobiia bacterium]
MKRIILFIAGALSLLGQKTGSIHGIVTDPSGAVAGGAAVTVYSRDGGARRITTASPAGEYLLEALSPGEYLVESQAGELRSRQSGTVRLEPGKNHNHDIRLELPQVSARVVVTASATAETTDQTSKAFDVIDAGEIARRQEFSVMEALRLTPGLRVMQLGGPGSLIRIHTRGLRAFDSSVLIDGFRFRDIAAPQADATGFLGDLLLFNSERIEVLRGSGSSLYGTHAIGGVMNVVTDQGGGPLHADVGFEGGGLGLLRGVAKVAGGAWRDRLLYSAGVVHLNVLEGVDGNDRHRNNSAQGQAQLWLDPRTKVGGRIYAVRSFTQLNLSPFGAPLAALPASLPVPAIVGVTYTQALNDPDSRRGSEFYSALVNVMRQLTPGTSLRAHYQGLTTSRENRDGPGGPRFQPLFNNSNLFDGRIDTAQARVDTALGSRHLISAGYEFEREAYDNLSRDENVNPAARVRARVRIDQSSHAFFVQEQLSLGERLRLSLSGRAQKFELSRPSFEGGAPRYAGVAVPSPPSAYTGDAAVSYFLPRSGTKLRAHVGNAYRAPALFERYGTSFFNRSFSALGDPRLAPERSIGLDGGFDQYLAGSRLRISGTYFYTRLQQVIGFDSSGAVNPATDPFGRFGGYRNTGGGLARGMEWSVEAHPTRSTRINSSYTYTKTTERVSSLLGGSLRGIRISDHMFTATATQQLLRGLDATFDLFAASDYIFPLFVGGSRPFLFPGPRKADLALTYRRPVGEKQSAEFYTRIENLFNRLYHEDGFRAPGAWAVGGMRFRF